MNLKKLELAPTQDLVYIVDLGRLYLPDTWFQALTTCVRSFSQVGAYKPAHQFLRLLGLMAALLQSMEYVHLHRHPIQWDLKRCWTHTTHRLPHPIFVSKDLVTLFIGDRTDGTCSRDCCLHLPTPPSHSLWMRDGRVE